MRSKVVAALVFLLSCVSGAQDYKQALPGYRYEFPRDHFNHPDYQTEWWYYTGNLKSEDGHRFGFELTFFRQGVTRDARQSAWRVHDLYMAHFALSAPARELRERTNPQGASGMGTGACSFRAPIRS